MGSQIELVPQLKIIELSQHQREITASPQGFAYASYHAARKTTSVVKSTLDPESSDVSLKFFPWRMTYLSEPAKAEGCLGFLEMVGPRLMDQMAQPCLVKLT
ncbi:hypothetical protein Prudu_007568 [Prunus dulcis]|uniref:Uncharacterized protein n=1 Tax=Prunus dulcis TaxID=3755 RepID=A0A4Y1R2E6_PRUDU|nr:hypothetical protein Prudu_007568 [Prunus dulcis]